MSIVINSLFRLIYKEDVAFGEGTATITDNQGNIITVNKINASVIPLSQQLIAYFQNFTGNTIEDALKYLYDKINNPLVSTLTDKDLLLDTDTIAVLPVQTIITQQDLNKYLLDKIDNIPVINSDEDIVISDTTKSLMPNFSGNNQSDLNYYLYQLANSGDTEVNKLYNKNFSNIAFNSVGINSYLLGTGSIDETKNVKSSLIITDIETSDYGFDSDSSIVIGNIGSTSNFTYPAANIVKSIIIGGGQTDEIHIGSVNSSVIFADNFNLSFPHYGIIQGNYSNVYLHNLIGNFDTFNIDYSSVTMYNDNIYNTQFDIRNSIINTKTSDYYTRTIFDSLIVGEGNKFSPAVKGVLSNSCIIGNENLIDYSSEKVYILGNENAVYNNKAYVIGSSNSFDDFGFGYIIGDGNAIYGSESFAIGENNIASGLNNYILGKDNVSSVSNAITIGFANTLNSHNIIIIGHSINNHNYDYIFGNNNTSINIRDVRSNDDPKTNHILFKYNYIFNRDFEIEPLSIGIGFHHAAGVSLKSRYFNLEYGLDINSYYRLPKTREWYNTNALHIGKQEIIKFKFNDKYLDYFRSRFNDSTDFKVTATLTLKRYIDFEEKVLLTLRFIYNTTNGTYYLDNTQLFAYRTTLDKGNPPLKYYIRNELTNWKDENLNTMTSYNGTTTTPLFTEGDLYIYLAVDIDSVAAAHNNFVVELNSEDLLSNSELFFGSGLGDTSYVIFEESGIHLSTDDTLSGSGATSDPLKVNTQTLINSLPRTIQNLRQFYDDSTDISNYQNSQNVLKLDGVPSWITGGFQTFAEFQNAIFQKDYSKIDAIIQLYQLKNETGTDITNGYQFNLYIVLVEQTLQGYSLLKKIPINFTYTGTQTWVHNQLSDGSYSFYGTITDYDISDIDLSNKNIGFSIEGNTTIDIKEAKGIVNCALTFHD